MKEKKKDYQTQELLFNQNRIPVLQEMSSGVRWWSMQVYLMPLCTLKNGYDGKFHMYFLKEFLKIKHKKEVVTVKMGSNPLL